MSEVQKDKVKQTPVSTGKDESSDPPFLTQLDGYKRLELGITGDSSRQTFGTSNHDVISLIMKQLTNALPRRSISEEEWLSELNGAIAVMHGIQPRDELEAMLASQMVAIQCLAMDMVSRTTISGQTFDGVNANVNRVTKLMRTFTAQMEALQKYRTKGQQTIQVQHVQVNEGGQAIVGNVKTGGGRGNE